jgi:hypothetical protein
MLDKPPKGMRKRGPGDPNGALVPYKFVPTEVINIYAL